MALRVIQPSDEYKIENIVGCMYAEPGLRKSTLAQTCDRPLTLDFDRGIHRASFRKAFVAVNTWDDVATMEQGDFEGYATAVVDTAGRALDALAAHIIKRDPKMANRSGGLSLQGYGALKTEFAMFLRKLRSYGLNVLLVLHSDEQKDGDNTVVRIDAQGGSKQEIYKVSDFMGRLTIDHEGVITLTMSPSDVAFGKNPAYLPKQVFRTIEPSSTHMAKVFALTLEKINAMTEEQREVSAALEAWRVKVMAAPDADALTKLIAEVPTDPRVQENAKRVLNSGANDRGFRYDKDVSKFVLKTPAGGNVAAFPAQQAAQAPAQAAEAPAVAATTESAAQATREREPGEEGPDDDLPTQTIDEKRVRLAAVFAEKYPEPSALLKAFKIADAACFFKGKVKGARSSPADLSDMDVAIMLHAIETGQLTV